MTDKLKRGNWVLASQPILAFMLMPETGNDEILVRQGDAGIVQWIYNGTHATVRWNETGKQLVIPNNLLEKIDSPAELAEQCYAAVEASECFDINNPEFREVRNLLCRIVILLKAGEVDVIKDRKPPSSREG